MKKVLNFNFFTVAAVIAIVAGGSFIGCQQISETDSTKSGIVSKNFTASILHTSDAIVDVPLTPETWNVTATLNAGSGYFCCEYL